MSHPDDVNQKEPDRRPDTRDEHLADGVPSDPHHHTGNAPLPGVGTGRRTAMVIGVVLMLAILIFLVWFVATNTEQDQGGGGLSYAGEIDGTAHRR